MRDIYSLFVWLSRLPAQHDFISHPLPPSFLSCDFYMELDGLVARLFFPTDHFFLPSPVHIALEASPIFGRWQHGIYFFAVCLLSGPRSFPQLIFSFNSPPRSRTDVVIPFNFFFSGITRFYFDEP